MKKLVDFRAGATHTGFALFAQDGVQIDEAGVLRNVSLVRDGRVYLAVPGGEWSVMAVSFEAPPEAKNENARVVASDSTANGLGMAIIAFREGGVFQFPAYRRRGPSQIWRWDGARFEKCTGLSEARALGWLPPKEPKEMEQIL